jgi:hypothetical protein
MSSDTTTNCRHIFLLCEPEHFCLGSGAPDLGVLLGSALPTGFGNCIQHSLFHGEIILLLE